jgi:uncharacterized iron-regulated membrane protein
MTSGQVRAAVARAEAATDGQAVALGWPTDQKAEWTVSVKPERGPDTEVSVATANLATKVEAARGEPPQTLARTMRQVHDGDGLPFVWQLIVFLGGVLPAGLGVTGVIMWWRARNWRGDLATRQRERASA